MRKTHKITAILLPLGMLVTPGIAFAQIIPGQIVLPKTVAKIKPTTKSDDSRWYLKSKDDHNAAANSSEKYVPKFDGYSTSTPIFGNVDISTTNQFTRYEGRTSTLYTKKLRDTYDVDPDSYVLKARTRW